jgi:hypothetical protein
MIVVRARSVARAHPCDTTNLLQFAVFLPTLAPLQIFFYQKLRTEILEPEYSSLNETLSHHCCPYVPCTEDVSNDALSTQQVRTEPRTLHCTYEDHRPVVYVRGPRSFQRVPGGLDVLSLSTNHRTLSSNLWYSTSSCTIFF